MGFFGSTAAKSDEHTVSEVLSRGVIEVIAKDELRKKLLSGKKLRVKLGIDPTSPNLHLGRAVPLLKLRDFQMMGHRAVLIVGDFTAVIGDTSDKEAERPMLSSWEIDKNKRDYFRQIGKLIDLSNAELHYNSKWLEKLTYKDVARHANLFSVADFTARDVIARRISAGKRVSLREMIYPLMQGYDSVATHADIELGGIDQKFNLLAGRTLQENYGQEPQGLVMNSLIEGLDGRKMSSSWNNTITLTMPAVEMYGKLMSIDDTQIRNYFEMCTRVPRHEIANILESHPKEAKMSLSYEITSLYHGVNAARQAQESFVATFSKGEIPKDIPTVTVPSGYSLLEALSSLGESHSELRRLVSAGAISNIETGEVLRDIPTSLTESKTLRIGKHRFLRILIKD